MFSFQPQTTYEEIIGLFTEIIIDSTYHAYDNNSIVTTGRHTTRYKYVVLFTTSNYLSE